MTKRTPQFSPEVCEPAVWMMQEHQGEHSSRHAAIRSLASKIGCSGETLRNWIKEAEISKSLRTGRTMHVRERIRVLEREVRELRQVNQIPRKASAYFAMAKLDRRERHSGDGPHGTGMVIAKGRQ